MKGITGLTWESFRKQAVCVFSWGFLMNFELCSHCSPLKTSNESPVLINAELRPCENSWCHCRPSHGHERYVVKNDVHHDTIAGSFWSEHGRKPDIPKLFLTSPLFLLSRWRTTPTFERTFVPNSHITSKHGSGHHLRKTVVKPPMNNYTRSYDKNTEVHPVEPVENHWNDVNSS